MYLIFPNFKLIEKFLIFFNYSEDCQPKNEASQPPPPPRRRPITITPEKTVALLERVSKPYLGMVTQGNEKLWHNHGFVGRFIGPIEDTYLEFVQQNQFVPQEAIRMIA